MATIPEVSVIVPFFNREQTLEACIDSVLSQTFSSLELILINDGSTDGSETRISGYLSENVRLVALEQNQGPSLARNRGIQVARGRWIALLDSDDVWHPEKLTRQLEYHGQHRLQGIASCTGYRIRRSQKNEGVDFIPAAWDQQDFRAMWICDVCAGSTLLAPREVFSEIGDFHPQMRRLEDREWLIRYSAKYPLAVVPDVLAEIKPSGFSDTVKVVRASRSLIDIVSQSPQKHGWRNWNLLQASLDLEIASAFISHGRKISGIRYLLSAVMKAPVSVTRFVLRRFLQSSTRTT